MRRADQGVTWSEYDACHTCHCAAGMQCRRVGGKPSVRLAPALDKPHRGRPKLSR